MIVNNVRYLCKMRKLKRNRTRSDYRTEILEAAKTLFLSEGYSHTSMRKIAQKVGITATTIYSYYENKADIVHALHQEGFKLLNQRFYVLSNVKDPFERLKAMGHCYIQFAVENSDYYEIMFSMKESLKHIEDEDLKNKEWPEGMNAFRALISGVQACQETGYFKEQNPLKMATALWANVHGLCNLNNNGRLKLIMNEFSDQKGVTNILDDSFELFLSMLEKF